MVVTHHRPSAQSVRPRHLGDPFNTALVGELDELVGLADPSLHGLAAVHASDRRSRWAAALTSLPALGLAYFGAGFWPAAGQGLAWQPLPARTASRIQALHRPALVEFTAQWCLNCRVMEKTVYRDPSLVRAVREAGAVPLQVDLTRPDPVWQPLLARYGGAGLPFLAILDRAGREAGNFSGLFTAVALVGRRRLSTHPPR